MAIWNKGYTTGKRAKEDKEYSIKIQNKYVGNKNNTNAIEIKKENEKTLRKLARNLGSKIT